MLIQQLIISHHHHISNHIAIQGSLDFFYNRVKTISVPITFSFSIQDVFQARKILRGAAHTVVTNAY